MVTLGDAICASFIGGRLLYPFPSTNLLPLLAAILILPAVKVSRCH